MIQAQMPRNEVIIQDRVVKWVSSISSDLCSDTVFLFIGVAYSLISQGEMAAFLLYTEYCDLETIH